MKAVQTPTAAWSQRLEFRILDLARAVPDLAAAVAACGGRMARLAPRAGGDLTLAEADILLPGEAAVAALSEAVRSLSSLALAGFEDRTFAGHRGGKLSIECRTALAGPDDLAMAYTPGVARVCKAIERDPEAAWDLTIKGTTVAVVTDGTAVLGLGDIGPLAGLPVMEGKAALFRVFGGVNAFPVCLATKDPEEIIATTARIAPVFGGINLEDISAPRCFMIEERLDAMLDIPVFHDDQHGTAIVVLAAMKNAARASGRRLEAMRVVISGAGAAGIAVASLLRSAGVDSITLCDSKGIVAAGRADLNDYKKAFAVREGGDLAAALVGADAFVGVSAPGIVTRGMVERMRPQPIVFTLSNPVPEVMPEELDGLGAIVATGRSDYPNQINNVLAFPGIFAGALSCRARGISRTMHRVAADALSGLVDDAALAAGQIIPGVFDPRVAPTVSTAIRDCAVREGLARI